MFQTTNQFPCGPIILPLPSGKQLHITMAEITMLLLGKLTKLLGSFSIAMLPSGNQTWHAGKWTIEIGDFPSKKPLLIGNFYWENSPFLLEQLPIDGHFP